MKCDVCSRLREARFDLSFDRGTLRSRAHTHASKLGGQVSPARGAFRQGSNLTLTLAGNAAIAARVTVGDPSMSAAGRERHDRVLNLVARKRPRPFQAAGSKGPVQLHDLQHESTLACDPKRATAPEGPARTNARRLGLGARMSNIPRESMKFPCADGVSASHGPPSRVERQSSPGVRTVLRSQLIQGGRVILTVVVGFALVSLYWFPIRRWFGRWGTTPVDLARVMRGDAAIVRPTHSATLAVTVHARPDHIWPWLLQMGYRRGGLYSCDWLDQLFGYLDRPSANRILPEYQHLAVGDEIPIGRGQGFLVTAIEANRALVLSGEGDGFQWVWQLGLYPLDEERTRLVSRSRVRVPSTVGSWLLMRAMEPAAFLMTRRMLLGLRRRAEALALAGANRPIRAA
jgi:hypothetical protein